MNQDPIISLSDNALKHIMRNVEQQNALGFRLAIKKTGCSGYAYVPDIINQINADDLHFSFQNLEIYVAKDSAQFLQGTVVDFQDQGFGQTKLIFHNPNAANLCGCGESFNLAEPEE